MTQTLPPQSMEEKKLETPETAAATPEKCDTQPKHGKREKLPMEKKFDQWVYGGISYFAQAAIGVILSRWLVDGNGRKHYEPIAKWTGKNVIEKLTPHRGAAAIDEARSKIIVTTMIMVGNAFLIPVKMLENRKPQIVREMTEKDNARREACGEVIAPEEKARQQELLQQLEHAPKQSWLSLLCGRAFGLAAVYAVNFGIGEKTNQWGEDKFANAISQGLDTVGVKGLAKSPTLRSYAKISANDFFYSTVSAGGLYLYSHFLHPHKKTAPPKPAQPVDCAPALTAPEVPASAAPEESKRHTEALAHKAPAEQGFTDKVARDASANPYAMSV